MDNTRLIAELEAGFRRRWRPQDHGGRDLFNEELTYLIHTIYREAQTPALNKLAEIFNRLPFTVTVPSPAKGAL